MQPKAELAKAECADSASDEIGDSDGVVVQRHHSVARANVGARGLT